MIFMYHSVDEYETDPHGMTVTPARFRGQLAWLASRGLRGVAMRDYLAASDRRRLVALTFDDAYTDFMDNALPALREHGFGATLFVPAGQLSRHNSWDDPAPQKAIMSPDAVREAAAAGVEIGSHGLLHVDLPAADEDALAGEIEGSRAALRELTGQEVAGFCYPFGRAGEREITRTRAAGYDYACVTAGNPYTGRFALRRVYVGDGDGPGELRTKRIRDRVAAGRDRLLGKRI
jgi:peptidoglycan/xylan/chitin deacetylase (PgdA/CDA1 family)